MALRGKTRAAVLQAHTVLGWLLVGWWALVGLTGSLLVFYPTVDTLLDPGLRPQRPVAVSTPSPEAVLAALQRDHPQRTGPWRLEMPLHAEVPLTARYPRPAERAQAFFAPLMVTLDPGRLAPTSARFWGDFAVTWVYDLHYTLLLGETGRTVVGTLGLLGLGALLSGLALWWPTRTRWKDALRWRWRSGAARWHFDMHTLAGAYSAPVLLVLSLSGVALAWPDTTRDLLGLQPMPAPQVAPAPTTTPRLGLDAIVQRGLDRFPGAELRWVEASYPDSPIGAGRPVVLRLYQPGEPSRRFPHTRVWLHPHSGALLAVHDPAHQSPGATVQQWLHPLHNGEALGLAGRWLAVLAGLVPAWLGWTGLRRWWIKRCARKQARA